MAIRSLARCNTNTPLYLATTAGGAAIAWSYIDPHSAAGYLSTLVSGVVGSQIAIQGAKYARQNISNLYSRVFPEKFVGPKIIKSELLWDGNSAKGGLEIAFCEIGSEGNKELIPLHRKFAFGEPLNNRVYTKFPGSYEQALLLMAQSDNINYHQLFQSVLEHPGNKSGVTLDRFLSFLCDPKQSGSMPIHRLTPQPLHEALKLIQEKKITVDLSSVSITGETLFQKCLGNRKYQSSAELLLQIAPKWGSQYLADVIESGNKNLVETALQEQRAFPLHEKWLIRAYQGDCNFSDSDYTSLPQLLQNKIFRVANMYNQYALVEKLRTFHPFEEVIPCHGPGIVSVNMDAVQIRNQLLAFFHQKRREGLFYTEHEFATVDRTQFYDRDKGFGIARVLGRDYIEKTAQKLSVTSVKVPKKTMVLSKYYYNPEDGTKPDPFKVYIYNQSDLQDAYVDCGRAITVWAEKITPVSEYVTREQMEGLLQVLETTGYDDVTFNEGNITYGINAAGEKAFYFVDTPVEDFRQVPMFFHNICNWFPGFMKPEDHEWLMDKLEAYCQRVATRRTEEEVRMAYKKEEMASEKYGFSNRSTPLQFAPKELIPEINCEHSTDAL